MRKLAILAAVTLSACGGPSLDYKPAVEEWARDPASLVYKDVKQYTDDQGTFVCGKFKGRNGFGGYSDYNQFFYDGQHLTVMLKLSTEANDVFGDPFVVEKTRCQKAEQSA